MGYLNIKRLLHLALVQNGIRRPCHLTRKLVTVTGTNLAICESRLTGYLVGKIIPAANALIRKMIDSFAIPQVLILGHSNYQSCQIAGIRGRTYLVKDNIQRWPLLHQPQHGLDEIVAILAV